METLFIQTQKYQKNFEKITNLPKVGVSLVSQNNQKHDLSYEYLNNKS